MKGFFVAFILAAQCPQPIIENQTNTWTKFDQQTFDRAITRCSFYFPKSPCLKKFIKLEERRYHAVCGKKE